jgi:hypothetical protein
VAVARGKLIGTGAALAVSALLALAGCGGGSASTTPDQASHSSAAPAAKQGRRGEAKGGEASIEEFGQEATGPERKAMLAAFEGYLNALGDKDYAGACAHLSQLVHESLAQLAGKGSTKGCASLLAALLSPSAAGIARVQAEGQVSGVRVGGERGFVLFHAPGARLYQQTMVREGGRWKAATVSASVLVPEL